MMEKNSYEEWEINGEDNDDDWWVENEKTEP